MSEFESTTNEERVKFLTEQYELTGNAAKALLLAEVGFSASGIAKRLGVTEGTARKYLNQLENRIGPRVTETLPKSVKYATFPGDTVEEPEYSANKGELDKKFQDQRLDVNKGAELAEIPDHLITIEG